ncbi:hypothetical protein D3C71_1332890 [compost metagenome]
MGQVPILVQGIMGLLAVMTVMVVVAVLETQVVQMVVLEQQESIMAKIVPLQISQIIGHKVVSPA